MLKLSCNVATDKIQAALAQCRFRAHPTPRPSSAFRRRGAVCCFPPAGKAPVLTAVVPPDGAALVDHAGSGGLADGLRLGSLTEDGLSYKEKFIVRCYEVGINKTATVETIANLLQVPLYDSILFSHEY